MADTEKLIRIIFEGVDKTTGTLKDIGGGVENFGKSIGDIAGPVAALGDSILTVDKYLAALAVGGLALASAKAIDYQDALADLNKVMGEGETLTDDMKKQQKDLASTYGIATTEIIQSQAGLQQSGYDAADSLTILGTSAKLAASSELSASESTDLLKRSLIGYELSASKAVDVADLWNLTANKSSTDVRQLGEGFAIVGRQAKNAGFTMEELAAALTPIIGVFGSGSEAGNAMSITLSSLNNPTNKATSAIKDLLKVSGPLKDQYANTADLFKGISAAFRELPDAQKDSIAALIVGKDQAKRATLAFNDFGKELKKVDAASRQVGKSLDDEVAIALKLTSIQVDILKVKFTDFFTAIGLQYDKELSGILSGLSGVFGGFEIAINDDAFKPLFDLIRSSGVEMSTLLDQIAKNLPEALSGVDFKGIADSLDSLKKNIFDIFDDIDLSTTEGLQKAIQLVVDSIETLIQVTDGMLTAWQPLFDLIGDSIDYFNDMDDATKETTGNLIGIAQQVVLFGGVLATTGLVIKAFSSGLGVFGSAAKGIASSNVFTLLASQIDKFRTFMVLFNAGLATSAAATAAVTTAMLGAAAIIGAAIGTIINQIPGIQEAVQKLFALLENNKDFDFDFKTGDTAEDIRNKAEALLGYRRNLRKIRDEAEKPIKIDVELDKKRLDALEKTLQDTIKKQQDELRLKLRAEVDKQSIAQLPKDVASAVKAAGLDDTGRDAFIKIRVELDESGKKLAGDIDVINTELFKLTERKREIEVVAEFNVKNNKVSPNELALEFKSINGEINSLTSEKKSIQIELEENDSFQKLEKAKEDIDIVTKARKVIRIKTEVNEGKGIGEIASELKQLEDGSWTVELKAGLEGKGEEEVKEKIDELSKDRKFVLEIETKKMQEETKRVVEQIKSSSKIMEKAMDIQFQLDIKQAEIDLTKITKAFDSTKEVLIAITQASADMFGAFSADFDIQTLSLFHDQLRQNLDIQREQADQQEKLNDAILRELELKNQLREKFLNGDETLLKISVDESLDADLAALMKALIPRLQLWGSENDVSLLIEASA